MSAPAPSLAALAGDGSPLWRSLDELAGSPEALAHLEAEFPDAVRAGGIDRRSWLRLMGASLALGGLSACGGANAPAPLLSQVGRDARHPPGVPVVVASTFERDGQGFGVLVKSQDGRPIKIEGNPLHPASLGATDVFAQAEVLSLYDPDRSDAPVERGQTRAWEDLERFIRPVRNQLVVSEGKGLHVLLPPLASPTLERLVGLTRQLFPHARWYRHAPVGDDNRVAGAVAVFGRPVDLVYDLKQADTVLQVGGDLFFGGPAAVRYAADWQARRRATDRPLPRLFAVESCPSLAGARADERVALAPREVEPFLRALAGALGVTESGGADLHPAARRIADALQATGSRAFVTVGREQEPSVHALAHAINLHLRAVGTTVRAIEPVVPPVAEGESLADVAKAIDNGLVSHLLILGANPVYDAPADLDFSRLIGRVPVSLHLGYHRNETASVCRWHVPQCHPLEAFGDLRAFDGTLSFRQPAVARLVPSLSLEETLGLISGQPVEGKDLLRATWRDAWGEAFEERLAKALEDGVVPDSASPAVEVRLREGWAPAPASSPSGRYDVVFVPDPSVWDGRYANNAWLQELPKPLTKQVWGNAALIAPETAAELNLATGDTVDIAVGANMLSAPVWVQPGHAAKTVTLPLGYGRWHGGSVGNAIGFNAYRLRTSRDPWLASGEIRRTGQKTRLVTTQQHHALHGRDIVRVVPADAQATDGPVAYPSLYPEWRYEGHAWGMAIDLDACLGCNACVVACQAENNVAVVGADQVAKGREMHWLRIDRYYGGEPQAPETYFQPLLCMHCEKAPCEVVCPVNATVHSSEGLNDMVYNRCVGTRICSNNCPYKVRRFNFLDHTTTDLATPDDVFNPQVTVRERGVMEKCTYCVQRIGAARADARLDDRSIRDGEVTTACQQACPTQAIVFGDVNDPQSAVSRLKRSPRNYALLGELNTQPRTTYLARIGPARGGGA
jgi:molybdopterin-containing oxidoreductase family iron-sulfur binding subunit